MHAVVRGWCECGGAAVRRRVIGGMRQRGGGSAEVWRRVEVRAGGEREAGGVRAVEKDGDENRPAGPTERICTTDSLGPLNSGASDKPTE